MSDMGDDFRAWKEHKRQHRQKHGVECQDCKCLLPRAHPSILLPGQKCRMHDYRAPRAPVQL